VPCVREVESSSPMACQILHSDANVSPPLQTFTQVAVWPWRYDAELGTANSLYAWA